MAPIVLSGTFAIKFETIHFKAWRGNVALNKIKEYEPFYFRQEARKLVLIWISLRCFVFQPIFWAA